MTTTAQTPRSGPYTGDGSTTGFSYGFYIAADVELIVQVRDTLTEVVTTKTLASDYTVAGLRDPAGGAVTFLTAPTATEQVAIIRSTPFTQTLDLQNRGAVVPELLEDRLDTLTRAAQDLSEVYSRTLQIDLFGITDVATDLSEVAASAIAAAASAAEAALYDGPRFDTVALLLADLVLDYTTNTTGDYIRAAGFRYIVAASGASDQHLTTAGGLKLYVLAASWGVDVRAFGAVGDGTVDDTAAIEEALQNFNHVVFPAGTYRTDTTIQLNSNKTIQMLNGCQIERTTDSAETTPVIWVRGQLGSIIGAGAGASIIRSRNRAPNGVVLVGHESMAVSHGNVQYNTLKDFLIIGAQSFGQTSGADDICLHIQNPQIGGLVAYFQTISNVQMRDANTGLYIRGWGNGNLINQLHGFRLGNATQGGDTQAMIYNAGGLDNALSDIFFHSSANSIGLCSVALDNTGTAGGSLHTPQYNSFKGLVFEQGGASAKGLVIRTVGDSVRCFYEVRPNVVSGNTLFSTFNDVNFLIGFSGRNEFVDIANTIAERRLNANSTDDTIYGDEWYGQYDALAENTTYDVATITLSSGRSAIVEFEYAIEAGGGLDFQGGGLVRWRLDRSQAGTVTATVIHGEVHGLVRPCQPKIAGAVVTIPIKVNNNGTATTHSIGWTLRRTGSNVFTTINYSPVSGTAGTVLGRGTYAGPASGSAGWETPIYFGTAALWVDSTGDLRIKASLPTSDTDGTVVGTQS